MLPNQNDEFRVLLARTNEISQPQVKISLPSGAAGSLVTWETVTRDTFGSCQILSNESSGKVWQVDLPSQSVGLFTLRSFSGVKPETLPSTSAASTSGSMLQSGGTNLAQTLFTFGTPQSKKTNNLLPSSEGQLLWRPTHSPAPLCCSQTSNLWR